MARDPRKTLVRVSEATDAGPFNRRSAQALLADLSSRQPTRTGPAVNITVTHRLAPRYQAPVRHQRVRPSRAAVGWAAIAAGVIVGVLTGLATLQNNRLAAVVATSTQAPPVPSAFVVRPAPEAPVVAVAPEIQAPVVAAIRPPPSPRRPAVREPRPASQAPVLYANRDPTPANPTPTAIDRQAPEPTELAMIAPPPTPIPARPRALVVVRQSGAEVLGAAPRAPGARVERGGAEELRSLDAERMAAAVDARQAVRLP